MKPYGYDNNTKSAIGASYIFFGMLASLIFAKVLDKTRKYLMTLRVICFACIFVWAAGLYTLPSGHGTYMLINMSVAGFFTVPIISVGFQFGIETSYPAGEAMSNGVFSFMVQIVSTLILLIGQQLCTRTSSIDIVYLFIGIFSVSALATLFVKEDLRRF